MHGAWVICSLDSEHPVMGCPANHVPSSLVRLFIILSSTPEIFNFIAGIRMIISILSS